MHLAVLGEQAHSISHTGIAMFHPNNNGYVTVLGSNTIDLASAPIMPGTYQLEITTVLGSTELFLPRYVNFTLDGAVVLGSRSVSEGLDLWKQLGKKIKSVLHLPDVIPDFAVAPMSTEVPTTIHIRATAVLGSITVYRL